MCTTLLMETAVCPRCAGIVHTAVSQSLIFASQLSHDRHARPDAFVTFQIPRPSDTL